MTLEWAARLQGLPADNGPAGQIKQQGGHARAMLACGKAAGLSGDRGHWQLSGRCPH